MQFEQRLTKFEMTETVFFFYRQSFLRNNFLFISNQNYDENDESIYIQMFLELVLLNLLCL